MMLKRLLVAVFILVFLIQCVVFLIGNSANNFSARLNRGLAVNPHNYEYTLNPTYSICGTNENMKLLAMIPTAMQNYDNRMAIRKTWANSSLFSNQIKAVFLLGTSTDPELNETIKNENDLHHDIVQENFIDNYYNLTTKVIMGMKWASTYCDNAKFLIKIDDDAVLNTPKVLSYLHTFEHLKNTAICEKCYGPCTKVIRDRRSKYYESFEDYPAKYYADYCGGSAYIITTDLAGELYKSSLYNKIGKFEDAYMGGLMKQLKTSFMDIVKYYKLNEYRSPNAVRSARTEHVEDYLFIFISNHYDILNMWNVLVKSFF